MISIHAIQFLVEIINCTCLLLAGNFCSGRNNKKQEKGGGEKMLISSHTWKL